ncbi:hypothetical protein DPMN_136612 [Dreissena polymorpha]|uniref:Uncharacterized protein n=1 Tax=Dreissena polymorpha TaxID=45954 RepID=A0A9D4G351_DREPO|nr:hypothetical protein DPMN_136612 [Dreissena polymorpha]
MASKFEADVETISSNILPHLRTIDVNLETKTTLCMSLSSVCLMAFQAKLPVVDVAETLKPRPRHLKTTTVRTMPYKNDQRLRLGNEVMDPINIATLDAGEWVDDKVSSQQCIGIKYVYLDKNTFKHSHALMYYLLITILRFSD